MRAPSGSEYSGRGRFFIRSSYLQRTVSQHRLHERGGCYGDERQGPHLEGMRAMNSSPDGQSFSRYTKGSPSLDLGRSEHANSWESDTDPCGSGGR